MDAIRPYFLREDILVNRPKSNPFKKTCFIGENEKSGNLKSDGLRYASFHESSAHARSLVRSQNGQ